MTRNPIVVGITGASGAPYARRLLQFFYEERHPAHLLFTNSAREVIEEETRTSLGKTFASLKEGLRQWIGPGYGEFMTVHELQDWHSPLASGSHKSGPMVIVPCSIHTLSAIANSLSANLLERRADIMLKEKQKLILVLRETPLHTIHLEHLVKLSQTGVHILPAMPGFYHHPETIQDLTDFMVGRILDTLDIPHRLYRRWKEIKEMPLRVI